MIVVVPAATPVARPVAEMVAVAGVPEDQEAEEVTFCVEPSEKVAVAVNCWVKPAAMLGVAGVTETLTSVTPVMLSAAVPEMVPLLAVIVVPPTETGTARPVAAPIVAIAGADDVQAVPAAVVMSRLVPSEKSPVALNWTLAPPTLPVPGFGVTVIEVRTAEVTVSLAVPEMAPTVAVMTSAVALAATPVARPVAEMVAVARVPEVQDASEVTFCVVESERVAVAVNCCVLPTGIDAVPGVTAMLTIMAIDTSSDPVAVRPRKVAVMVTVPNLVLEGVAMPVAPPMVAMVASDEVQADEVVTSFVDLSENVAVAVNGTVAPPRLVLPRAGVTWSAVATAVVTVRFVLPVIPPLVALIDVVPALSAIARPVASIEAIVLSLEDQVAVELRSCVVPSSKTPVAVYCSLTPAATVLFGGVTWMLLSSAFVTVSLAVPDWEAPPIVTFAVIVVDPGLTPLATPLPLTVAVAVSLEDQVAVVVTSCVVLLLKTAVAVNGWLVPAAIDAVAGVT